MGKPSKTYRIVMVDDDRDDLFLTRIALGKAHFPSEFIGLSDGKSLFEYIKNKGIGSIGVLLLDINMPVFSGYDILDRLSSYPHFSEIKVVMFSTSKKADDKQRALDAGAVDFFIKPSGQKETECFTSQVAGLLNIDRLAMAS